MSISAKSSGLGRHSVIYFAGGIVAVLSGIVMLPIYTHHLSPREYGLLETLLRFVSICMSVAFVGLRQGYLRFYFDRDEVQWRRIVTSTTLIGIALMAFGVVLPLLALFSQLAPLLGVDSLSFSRSLLLTTWLAFEACYLVGLAALQVRFRSASYFLTQSGRAMLLIGLNYYFLAVLKLDLTGALTGNLVASILSGGVAAVLLLRGAGVQLSRPTLRSMISFGAPYIPTAVFSYVVLNADRFALLHFGLAATLGLLSLAAKLGEMALSLLATPIENIWGPFAYSVRNDHDGPRRIGQLFVRYVAFSLLVGVGVSLGAPLAIDLLAPAEYEIASDLVPIVAISCICFNVSCLSDLGILITKRTHLKPLLYGSAAVVAVIMQLLLTPRFGLFGAAVASALTSIFQLMSTHFVASRQYRFIVDQRAVLILVTGAGAAFLLGNYLQQPGSSVLVRLMAVSAGTAVILGAIFASRVLTWQDLMTLRQQYASRGRAATESAP